MFDIHCHYLPGVDDGAQSLDEGLALIRAATENGVEGAILTPHLHPGRYQNTRSTLEPRFRKFAAAVAEAGVEIALHLGCELRLSAESVELLEMNEVPILGTWEGERVVLLEFPHDGIPVGAVKAVEFLRSKGYRPIMAHPERNKALIRDPFLLRPFMDVGCLGQITAASVCGSFGAAPQRTACAMIEQGWIQVVASDAHNLAYRPPLMAQARDHLIVRYGPEVAARLVLDNPGKIFRSRQPSV